VTSTLSVATPAAPPWRQCHASTLLGDAGGELLVAFFAGTAEGTDDNAIYLVRGGPRGDGPWAAPTRLTHTDEAHWNPVLARSPRGRLTLFFKRGRPISQWSTWVTSSPDEGYRWEPPVELVRGDHGGRGPVKNPPLVLPSGRWVAAASTESGGSNGITSTWDCFADVSDDDGDTWTRSPNIPIDHAAIRGPGIIQPAAWLGDEGVVFLMRSSTGHAWRAVSRDDGLHWQPAEETSLPNNNSGLCATQLPDRRVLCAHNTSDVPWGPRNQLALSVSHDDGRTWRPPLVIEALPPPATDITPDDSGVRTDGRGELSYPTIFTRRDDVLVSYTRERREIVVATVPLAALD
jgi:predicted neuraminidase